MKKREIKSLFIFSLYLILALITFSYIYLPANFEDYSLLLNFFFLLAPLAAIFCGLFAVSVYGGKSPNGQVFSLLTFSLLLFFLGEFFWMLLEDILEASAFPSIADFFYFLAYPVFLWGVIKAIKNSKIKISKCQFYLLGSLALIVFLVVGQLYLKLNSFNTLLENIFGLWYVFSDVMLLASIVLVVMILKEYRGGQITRPWVILAYGILSMFFADFFFLVFLEKYEEFLPPYLYIDLLWSLSYLLFALAFFYAGYIAQSLGDPKEQMKKISALKVANKKPPTKKKK